MLNRQLLVDFPMPVKFSFEQDLVEPNIGRIRPRRISIKCLFH